MYTHTMMSAFDPLMSVQLLFVWKLVIAAVLGALLGLERSLAGKHAGMRTYALVSLGSCLFIVVETIAAYQLIPNFSGVNPLQIASSVVLGVGFIGSGLAVFRGDQPAELTTATGIWVVAGVGMACGFGLYTLAFGATIIGILIFSTLLKLENGLRRRFGVHADEK